MVMSICLLWHKQILYTVVDIQYFLAFSNGMVRKKKAYLSIQLDCVDTCTEGTLPLTTALRDSEAVRLESIQDVSFQLRMYRV